MLQLCTAVQYHGYLAFIQRTKQQRVESQQEKALHKTLEPDSAAVIARLREDWRQWRADFAQLDSTGLAGSQRHFVMAAFNLLLDNNFDVARLILPA